MEGGKKIEWEKKGREWKEHNKRRNRGEERNRIKRRNRGEEEQGWTVVMAGGEKKRRTEDTWEGIREG